jgi:hypothetical protein
MLLMKEDVEKYVKRIAYRNPMLHKENRELWAEIHLARRILERMEVPFEKEEGNEKAAQERLA